MDTQSDIVTTKKLSEILGVSIRYVNKMAKVKRIEYHRQNQRGDRVFSINSLLIHLPEKHRITLSNWRNQQIKEKYYKGNNSEDQESLSSLPVLSDHKSKAVEPTNINALISTNESAGNQDPWFSLPETSREKAYKVLEIVNHARDIRSATKKGITKELKKYADRAGISFPTLQRHLKAADKALEKATKAGKDTTFAQIKALTPKYGKNKNKFRSWDQNAIMFAWSLYLNQKHLNLTDVYKETLNTGMSEGWRIGSYDSLRDAINRLDNATIIRSRKGNHAFESNCLTKILRDYTEIPPNFMWCGDHHIFDVFVKIPDGKGGWKHMRPWLTAWMDMRSRSFMGWVISFNPNSRCIAMALAHGISHKNDRNFPQHGKPDSVYIDNGKDYRCNYLRGEKIEIGSIDYPEIMEKYAALGIDPFYIDLEYDPDQEAWVKKRGQKPLIVKGVRVGGVYAKLNVDQHYAIAFHPWAKPIERAFRNVVQRFSRQLPGWCGSGHEQRPEKLTFELKSDNLLTLDEFCASFYDWVVNLYHKEPHRGHGMNNMSPDQVFTSLLPQPQIIEPKLLDFALMKKERVKLHNWGFSLNNREFELDLPINLQGGYMANQLIGEYASIYYDFNYRTIRVYKNGDYICDGKPLNRASFFTEDNQVMVDKLKLQSYQKQASKKVIEIIEDHSKDTCESDHDALLMLSREPEDQVSIPLQNSDCPEIPDECEDEVIPINEDERYRLILKKLARGKELSAKDKDFKARFEASAEYKSSEELYRHQFDYDRYIYQKEGTNS